MNTNPDPARFFLRCRLWAGLLAVACLPCGLAQEPDAEPPQPTIQTQVEFIEVTQERYTALAAGNHTTGNDSALREELAAMVSKGEAEVVETMVCTARDCHTAKAESITEFIYPTEEEPQELPPNTGSEGAADAAGPAPNAWDRRNLGSTLEVETVFYHDSGTVDMRFDAEMVRLIKNWIWFEWHGKHGTCHIQTPVFYTLRCNQNVFLIPGQPLLASTVTPKGRDGMPDPTRKIMVFVKCDLVPTDN
jgi:hypothetical protein